MIGRDDRFSACMSHNPADFVGYLQECKRTIKGFVGQTHVDVYIVTLKRYWEDSQGKAQKFIIPKSYYIPEGG